jgi:DNA-binding response OmpR family regulator
MKKMRIVIVEADVAYANKLAHQIVVEMGYIVAGRYPSAQSFLEAARAMARREQKEWDLILLSVHLPDSEGWRTAQQLRDLLPETPIITYTALESAKTFLSEIRGKP